MTSECVSDLEWIQTAKTNPATSTTGIRKRRKIKLKSKYINLTDSTQDIFIFSSKSIPGNLSKFVSALRMCFTEALVLAGNGLISTMIGRCRPRLPSDWLHTRPLHIYIQSVSSSCNSASRTLKCASFSRFPQRSWFISPSAFKLWIRGAWMVAEYLAP